MQAKKFLLFNEGIPWLKRERNKDFDIVMSCLNGTEVCELIGSYILQQLRQLSEHHSVWLYRDDGIFNRR